MCDMVWCVCVVWIIKCVNKQTFARLNVQKKRTAMQKIRMRRDEFLRKPFVLLFCHV